jgi:hypothetical protein
MYSPEMTGATLFTRIEESTYRSDVYTVALGNGWRLSFRGSTLRTWPAFRTAVALAGLFLECPEFEGRGGRARWLETVADAIQAGRRWRDEENERARRMAEQRQREYAEQERRAKQRQHLRDLAQNHKLN